MDGSGNDAYTRGGKDGDGDRGKSMVEIHASRLQEKKEADGRSRLRLLYPSIGAPALDHVLRECSWDADQAAPLLSKFLATNAERVAELERLRESRRAALSGDRAGSPPLAVGEGREGRTRDGSRDRRSRRRRGDSRDRTSRRLRDGSRDRRSRRRRGDSGDSGDRARRRRRDGARAPSPGAPAPSAAQQFGRYGILRDGDLEDKRPEFKVWASEVKRIELEVLPRRDELELFREYAEDYNTATLPSRKYYDLAQWERERAGPGPEGGSDGEREPGPLDDERALQRAAAAERAERQRERLAQAYQELQQSDKARDMRAQELLRARMGLAYRTGDQKEAHRLAARLAPDDK